MNRFHFILYITLIFASSCLWVSCYNNSGNEDYWSINEPAISFSGLNESDTIFLASSDTLNLNPLIQFMGNEKDLSYEWKIFSTSLEKDLITNEYPSSKIISDEKNLSYIVAEGPGNYELVYSVIDNTNNTITYYKLYVIVETVKGLLVLDQRNDNSNELHVIRDSRLLYTGLSSEKEGVARNLFSGSNNGSLLAGAKSIYRGLDKISSAYTMGDDIYVFGDSLALKVNPSTYKVTSNSIYSYFVIAPPSFNVQAQVMPTSRRELIMIDGRLFCYSRMNIGNTYFGIDIAPDDNYYAAPFLPYIPVLGIQYASVIFDTINHAFRPIDQFGSAVLDLGDTVTTSKPFNMSHINMNIQYLGNGNLNYTYGVFRNPANNKTYLLAANFAVVMGIAPKAVYKIDLSNLPGINEALSYAFSTRGHVMFYATPNAVYSATYKDGNYLQAFTPPSGETITKISIFKDQYSTSYDGKLLFIVTQNQTTHEGKVYIVEFNGVNGVLNNSTLKTYGQFGSIKQIVVNN